MPSGKIHHANWKKGWYVIIPTSIYLFVLDWRMGLGLFIGYGLGLVLDPDADQISITAAEGRLLKIPILGWLMVAYSTIYGAIFRKHHRSFWTHFPVFSTIIRCLFFLWPIYLLYYFDIVTWWDWHITFYGFMFVGLSFADFIHWIADVWPKKRLTRK